MPKVSSAAKDATKAGFGFQGGNFKVVESVYRFHQFDPNKEGNQSPPFTCLRWGLQILDDDLKPVNVDEIIYQEFPIEWSPKLLSETEKDKDGNPKVIGFDTGKMNFYPGNAANGDAEPENLCENEAGQIEPVVGTEGNALYGVHVNVTPKTDTSYIRILASMEKLGWKAEVNWQSYAPNYVGFVGHATLVTLTPSKSWKKKEPPTALEVDRIFVRPYEAKQAAGKATAKPAGKPAGATDGSASKTNGAAGHAEAEVGADESARLFAQALPEARKRLGGKETVKREDFQKQVQLALNGLKASMKTQRPIIDGMKNDDWLGERGIEGNFIFDSEAGTVTFG